MKWTNQKPTGPGHYWHREKPEYDPTIEHVCESTWYPDGLNEAKCLAVCFDGDWCYRMDESEAGGEWAGPIPKPETVPQPNGIDPGCALDLNEKLK